MESGFVFAIVALGGAEAVAEILGTIHDVRRWWL
jgi:hypothetical protein